MDLEDLASGIVSSSNAEEIFELIKELDLFVADYDFTLKLRDYFESEMKKEDAHETKE